MTRREFLCGSAATLAPYFIPLGLQPSHHRRPLRFAVLTDLHHGVAPDAQARLETFCDAVRGRRHLNLVMQLGDFNLSQADSCECNEAFASLPHRKIHVLGNHDMDKCNKATAVRQLGMKDRYYAQDVGDYRFVVLDLNHFKLDGQLYCYDHANWAAPRATKNWADPEQLAWLERELMTSTKPVILVSHQPLGFAKPGKSIPPEQAEILEIVFRAKAANPAGAVALSLFGHLHVDRLEYVGGIPFYCLNSASYYFSGGMFPYSKPLFAFMELTPSGHLRVEGVRASFLKTPPAETNSVVGRSASIKDRRVTLSGHLVSQENSWISYLQESARGCRRS